MSAHELLTTRDCTAWSCTASATGEDGLCDRHREAGVKPLTNGSRARTGAEPWSREEAIAAIQAFVGVHGRAPMSTEWTSPMGLPSYVTARKLFGTTQAAIAAASGSSPSNEGPKNEAVPPPAPEPERRQAVDKNEGDSAPSLVDLAQSVDTLSTRRREMLAELDALDAELRDALGACAEALQAHEIEDAA